MIRIGIVSTDSSRCTELRSVVEHANLGTVVAQSTCLQLEHQEAGLGSFASAAPQIILLDQTTVHHTIQTISLLTGLAPKATIMVVGDTHDPHGIIEIMRTGVREFLPRPLTSPALASALKRANHQPPPTNSSNGDGTFYGVTAAKEGSGATTVCINLAIAMANAKPSERVAVFDLALPVGDAAAYMNLKPRYSLSDALDSIDRMDTVLLESLMMKSEGVMFLPGFQQFNLDRTAQPLAITKLLKIAGKIFDRIIVDLPSTQSREEFRVIQEICSKILVITTPELPSLWRTHRLFHFINQTGGTSDFILILNRCHKKCPISVEKIEKTLGTRIFRSLPNDYPTSIESINAGKSIVSIPRGRLAKEFVSLAHEISGTRAKPRSRGILGLF